MKEFTAAAANTMQDQNTGLGNFMADIMREKQQQVPPPSQNFTQPDNDNEINVMGEDINKPQRSNKRREMSGPKDIDDILSNLKTVKSQSKSKKKERNVISFD